MPAPVYPASPTPAHVDKLEKGHIYWFNFNTDPASRTMANVHPCVIISKRNTGSGRVLISPISDTRRYMDGSNKVKYPYHALLTQAENTFLDKDSMVLLDQINTVAKTEFCEEWYLGKVENTSEIDMALVYGCDLFESIQQTYVDLIRQIKGQHTSKFSRR